MKVLIDLPLANDPHLPSPLFFSFEKNIFSSFSSTINLLPCKNIFSFSKYNFPFPYPLYFSSAKNNSFSKYHAPFRVETCRNRCNRRSCKIFVTCVIFPQNKAVSHIFCKFTQIHTPYMHRTIVM